MSSGVKNPTDVETMGDAVMRGILPLGRHLKRQTEDTFATRQTTERDQFTMPVDNMPNLAARGLVGPTNGNPVAPCASFIYPVSSPWPTGCVGPIGIPLPNGSANPPDPPRLQCSPAMHSVAGSLVSKS